MMCGVYDLCSHFLVCVLALIDVSQGIIYQVHKEREREKEKEKEKVCVCVIESLVGFFFLLLSGF